MDGKYHLAVFVFFYNKKDLEENKISRPEQWALLDLENGSVVRVYDCRTTDFCDESFEKRYSIETDNSLNISKRYIDEIWSLMDSVRLTCVTGEIDYDLYQTYLSEVLQTVPEEYKVFYRTLSI